MKRLIAIFGIVMALAACTPAQIGVRSAPAPLEATVIDERALITAYATFDTALTAIDALVVAGVIVPGTLRAMKVQQLIRTAQAALNAARAARRAGSATDYLTAMDGARDAMVQITAALGSKPT